MGSPTSAHSLLLKGRHLCPSLFKEIYVTYHALGYLVTLLIQVIAENQRKSQDTCVVRISKSYNKILARSKGKILIQSLSTFPLHTDPPKARVSYFLPTGD